MGMKKILGLDLGVASIGWALITEEGNKREIVGMGCRIVPLNTEDLNEFSSGNAISKNQKRRQKRQQRRRYDRYQLRRKALTRELMKHGMFDPQLFNLGQLELWRLRAKAVTDKVSLKELGRILYHLNQKRGYKIMRIENDSSNKDTDYVAEIKNRHQEIKEAGITIGQKFFAELQKNQYYRIKQQVFPREAYIEEFEAICKQQQKYYPNVLTDDFIAHLRDDIIYYQRKLKSQKDLVSVCEFEGFWTTTSAGKEIFVGPRVAPRSSPLFQVCKIWETINNITLKNRRGEELKIPVEKKKELFEYLDNNEKLTQSKLFEYLGLDQDDGWYGGKLITKGLQGNLTKVELMKYLRKDSPLLKFELIVKEESEETFLVDRKTGEVLGSETKKIVVPTIESQPLYQLWHTIYSIPDLEECKNALIKRFGLDQDSAEKLARIDFRKSGFGNKSVRAMRKILPYLMDGYKYSDACSYAGYRHSDSLTKGENLQRKLLDAIPLLPRNSLRQPVVEKILNQLINVVNAIMVKYGRPDEIRIELARELKQNKEERNETFLNLKRIERENEEIRKRLQVEYGLPPTRTNIIKWRLFHELSGIEGKVNAVCIYCGKAFGITDALKGSNVDVDHIIPRTLLFDDSQSNKVLAHRSCNETKGNRTAFDFMQSKGNEELDRYLERVNNLYKDKIIGKAKRDKLLMSGDKIPKDFIERQIRETQYIARKAKEILEQVCYNVWSTSGSVTQHLRRVWGWDDVLMNLQLPKYREIGLTEWVTLESNGQKHKKEIIKGWSKRDDHRHHAIDALVIACTQQGFIQRISNLSSRHTREEMLEEVEKQSKAFRRNLSILDAYLVSKRPFTTEEVERKTAEILVSFKAGKKVATFGRQIMKKGGKKIILQKKVIVPRGPLSEESVYGNIKTIERNKPVKYLFENPHLIFKPYIRALVEKRLAEYNHDTQKALASLKKEPIYLDKGKKKKLTYATCFKEEFVIKYPVEKIKPKDVEYIVDERVRNLVQMRLAQYKDREKEAFKETLYFNEKKKIPIRTVRLFTRLSAVAPIKRDDAGNPIGYVLPKNNHHVAIYIDENGKKVEHVCTFWHAVERKKYGFPVIIENPREVWEKILIKNEEYPDSFLQKLPPDKWTFVMSLQQNEMFVLGMNPSDCEAAIEENDTKLLSNYLYRVQKISSRDYVFRHHLETQLIDYVEAKQAKRFYHLKSIGALEILNPRKVKIDNLGQIVK
jgi:CRISPR-associated endonuclease Csn1